MKFEELSKKFICEKKFVGKDKYGADIFVGDIIQCEFLYFKPEYQRVIIQEVETNIKGILKKVFVADRVDGLFWNASVERSLKNGYKIGSIEDFM